MCTSRAVVLLAVGVLAAECIPAYNAGQDGVVGDTRAASALEVLAYTIDLTVDAEDTFDSEAVITLVSADATDTLVVNAGGNLRVDKKVDVYGPNWQGVNAKIPVDSVTEIGNEEVQLKLRSALIAGNSYNVTLTATGQFGNASDPGLVRAAFRDGGSDSWLAAIRGAPASARRVFPCIDGPAQVADITLSVSRPTTHSAVSNTHVVNSEQIAGGAVTRDTFASARLTPSQVGLVLAPLQRPELSSGVSVWARAQAAADVADVKKYVTDVSDAVGQLTGLPAAGLSVVALPGAEAAPTAGLAALNEDAVLYTGAPSSSQRDALLELAEAVAQPGVRAEARPEHWGDAWVLRGLGAHLRHQLADNVTGAAWRLSEQQGVLQLQEVLEAGAKTTDAALPPSTDDAARCSRAAVDKGAVLVRMLENAFQAAVYEDAVRRFYQLSVKKAVGLDDLIDAFENATEANDDSDLPTGVTAAGVLLSWTSKPGYPVVTVIRDYENNNMTVSQKKFSWSGSKPSTGASDEWWLPLSYTYAQENPPSTAFRAWLVPGENDMEVAIDHMNKYDWVYFNLKQLAPFRVNYDKDNWQLLVQELSGAKFDQKLEPAARAQLLGDALALARAGELDYDLVLDLASYLHQEDDVLPWLAGRRAFAYLEGVLDDEALAWLNAFEALLLKDVYLDGHFAMDGADPAPGVALLRELTATWACAVGYKKCLEHADEAYVKWRGQGEAPKPDLEEAVLCRAVAKAEHSLDAINQTLVALGGLVGGRRRSHVRAAACSTAYLGHVVENALSPSGAFLPSEVPELLEAASGSNPGWQAVVGYLRDDHDRISERAGSEYLESLSLHLASRVSSQEQLNQLLDAVRAATDSSLADVIQREAAVNLAWLEAHRDSVLQWLKTKVGPDGPTTSTAPPPTTSSPSSPTSTATPAPGPGPSTTPAGAAGHGAALWTVVLVCAAAMVSTTT